MSELPPPRLASVRTLNDLLVFLAGDLCWPIHSAELEDLTFEFDPLDDIGLPASISARVRRLLKLRPLSATQTFAVYFVEFESRYPPSTVLRRVCERLAGSSRRADVDRPIRNLDRSDLLFVSASGNSDEGSRIDFGHLVESQPRGRPVLRLIGWDPEEPREKLIEVQQLLQESLRWPNDNEVSEWCAAWGSMFLQRPSRVRGVWTELTEQERTLIQNLYAVSELTTDALPYTDDFEWIRRSFNDATRRVLTPFEFWRALTGARKAGRLSRKERGPAT